MDIEDEKVQHRPRRAALLGYIFGLLNCLNKLQQKRISSMILQLKTKGEFVDLSRYWQGVGKRKTACQFLSGSAKKLQLEATPNFGQVPSYAL